ATAVKARKPAVRVIGVQARVLPSIADGIAVRERGALTAGVIGALVDEVVTVSEEEIANAILLLLEIEKTVVEGAGATTLAALVNRPLGLESRTVVLVLSGGNIDVTMLSRIIQRGLVKDGRLVRLAVMLVDRPGALARLTALIAESRANILHIEHDRAFSRAGIGESEVELTLETSGREQIEEIKTRLKGAGYRVVSEGS
ncbi:MAG: pyridoxal-phosphate dependent enzyme, partial [Candidatus Rokubacteria bacterium]|nr:pyridoxal-phosphate dependent enzyme [Candidatus Rokubacteria bacterium]